MCIPELIPAIVGQGPFYVFRDFNLTHAHVILSPEVRFILKGRKGQALCLHLPGACASNTQWSQCIYLTLHLLGSPGPHLLLLLLLGQEQKRARHNTNIKPRSKIHSQGQEEKNATERPGKDSSEYYMSSSPSLAAAGSPTLRLSLDKDKEEGGRVYLVLVQGESL